jgi:hypothetical protein
MELRRLAPPLRAVGPAMAGWSPRSTTIGSWTRRMAMAMRARASSAAAS